MIKRLSIICSICLMMFLTGCENTDMHLATEAGLDAVQAITLSDEAVQKMAIQSAAYVDNKHNIAPDEDKYAKRLRRLVGRHLQEDGIRFNYKVYLKSEVNAFAMADGTIRIYSGLMDMLNDSELLFVIGHEMGHVAKKHIHKKIRLAYAASAVRKGIASQNNSAGEIARSHLGDFAELIMKAQFSQLEEKEADDYGLAFLKRNGYNPNSSVTALRKLATLGDNHSFLSSHPAPGKRAERLMQQLEGKAMSIEDSKQNLLDKAASCLESKFPSLYERLSEFLPWFRKRTE